MGLSGCGVGCAPLLSLVAPEGSAAGAGRWITLPSTRSPDSTGDSARAAAVAADCATGASLDVAAGWACAVGAGREGGVESCLPFCRFPLCLDT